MYWNSFKPTIIKPITETRQLQTGKIDKILHNDEKGIDGFIKYDKIKSIYFRLVPTDELAKKLTFGIEVNFKIMPPKEDGKKERAINIKLK